MKICTMCGEEKDRAFFEPKSAGSKKVFGKCRRCRNLLREERRKTKRQNGEQVELDRARNKWYKRKYGITLDEYDGLLRSQGGGCAICRKAEDTVGKRLHVDHDHQSGKVRGILCYSCNTGLGAFRDDISVLLYAVEYLSRGEGE